MHEFIVWLEAAIQALVGTIENGSYWAIFWLMAAESTVIPLPSEVVMIPAGYLAYQGKLDFTLVALSGTLGSVVGAYINYTAARMLGRPFLIKYGKYFLLPKDKFEKMMTFFRKHGEVGTFVGRLLPGFRHLISIPPGVAHMNLARFGFYTGLGAGIWCLFLTWFGYWVGSQQSSWQAAWASNKHTILIAIVVVVVATVGGYVLFHRSRRVKTA